MTSAAPNITLDVDLRNPGQFFACCGVLELAGRLWPESEGWFDRDAFLVTTGAASSEPPLPTVIRRLVEAKPFVARARDAEHFDDKTAPLVLGFGGIRLDWWLRPGGSTDADVLKLWSGNQTPETTIFPPLVAALDRVAQPPDHRLLHRAEPMTGRFGFDPVPAWNALDVGFSPNEQGTAVTTAPAVEILAAIGLQGFRPAREDGRGFRYATWATPLPLVAARAAASGALGGRRFRFTVVNRGKYKAFGPAEEIEKERRS